MRVLSLERIVHVGAVALARRSIESSGGGAATSVARLLVHALDRQGAVVGDFQRSAAITGENAPQVRRISGGPVVLVGRGTVHVALALTQIDALGPCEPRQIVNRHVRPLLRALTACGAPARFFGRDWIDVKGRPAAWVGFAHDSETGHAVLEAFVAVSSPFAAHPRASYLGKAPGTLDAIIGRSFDLTRVADAITAAYQAAWGARLTVEDRDVVADDVAALHEDAPPASVAEGWLLDPPWSASVDEAIGVVAAGRDRHGRLCVGGDLLASRDAIARLEARIDGASPDAVQAIVQEVLGDPRVAIDGVRNLTNVGDVIVRALTAPG